MVSLFSGCGSLHTPDPTYGSSIFQGEVENFHPQDATLWHSLAKVCSPLVRLTSSCTVCCIHSHITPFLFDFKDLTFSSAHKFFCGGTQPFWVEIYLSTFTTFHFIFRLIEPLWLIMWVSVVAQWYSKYIPLQRVISSAFACGLCHCCVWLGRV